MLSSIQKEKGSVNGIKILTNSMLQSLPCAIDIHLVKKFPVLSWLPCKSASGPCSEPAQSNLHLHNFTSIIITDLKPSLKVFQPQCIHIHCFASHPSFDHCNNIR